MIHSIPTLRSGRAGYDEIAKIYAIGKTLWLDELVLDFARCGFFEANLAAPLAAVLARIQDDSNEIKFQNIDPKIEAILCKNEFLAQFGFPRGVDTNNTTIKFFKFSLSEEERFGKYLKVYMNGRGLPQMTEQLKKRFIQSISEVFQNSVIHSGAKLGFFACGQFYPNLAKLDFTMADAGVGIRTNVRNHFRQETISSIEAIRWALGDGNTTKSSGQPGGIGLKLLKDFIELNAGKIELVSRLGYYRYCQGSETFEKMSSDFPGTIVNLEIQTNDVKSYRLSSEIPLNEIF